MAQSSPIDWTVFETAVARCLSDQTGLVVVWANEHAPQPAYPFARLKVIAGPVAYGRDDERKTTVAGANEGEEVAVEVCGPRDITVSCQVFCESSAPGVNARHYLGIAQASFGLPTVLETLRSSGIAVIDTTPPQDLDFIAGGSFKSRAGLDVRFRVMSTMVERGGYIATARVSATYKNPDGTTAVTAEDTYGA